MLQITKSSRTQYVQYGSVQISHAITSRHLQFHRVQYSSAQYSNNTVSQCPNNGTRREAVINQKIIFLIWHHSYVILKGKTQSFYIHTIYQCLFLFQYRQSECGNLQWNHPGMAMLVALRLSKARNMRIIEALEAIRENTKVLYQI